MVLASMSRAASASLVPMLAAVLSLAVAGVAYSAPRIALVVGNGGYDSANISRLANPVNDARLMAETLESVGFDVTLETEAGQDAMKRAIKAFGKRLRASGRDAVGLFYYAGHGVEAGGSNYLIPLGAEVENAMDLASDAVPAQWVLSRMEAAGNRLNMVILDACRNNPYAGRVRGGGRGLARMGAPSGSLIAYSAGPGQVAEDGEGGNSPYTRALAAALTEPGLKVEEVFKRVRVLVEDETGRTGRRQTPWESSSLRGDFYFVAAAEVDEEPERVAGGVTPTSNEVNEAKEAYEIAARENTIAAYRAVVEHFPGFYATLAQRKVEELEAAALATERQARREALAEKLGREFSPDAVGENGWTDLHWAAVLDLPRLAKELVERGMKVDVRLDGDGERFGNDLKRMLREFELNFDTWTGGGDTPIHVAAYGNALSVAEYLVGRGAYFDTKNGWGMTPLNWAAHGNAPAVAAYLVGLGADVNASGDHGDHGTPPLHWAADAGALAAAKYLVREGADVNAKRVSDGATPLHWAANSTGHPAAVLSVVEYLVEQGADVNAKENDGETPLHRAANMQALAVAKYLLREGADIHAKNDNGETALDRARRWGEEDTEFARFLRNQLE